MGKQKHNVIDGVSSALGCMGKSSVAAAEGKRARYFDYNKAAKILKQHGRKWAIGGLVGDWRSSSGRISLAEDGEVSGALPWGESNWALPAIKIDERYIPCWSYCD